MILYPMIELFCC